jgi:hypothetical protein
MYIVKDPGCLFLFLYVLENDVVLEINIISATIYNSTGSDIKEDK